jgi:hypothetical protein
VVWYQSYRSRFFALPEAVRALSPGAAATEFSFNESPDPSTLSQRGLSTHGSGSALFSQVGSVDTGTTFYDDPLRSPPRSPMSATHPLMDDDTAAIRTPPTAASRQKIDRLPVPATPFSAAPTIPRSQHPGRAECARIVATFFKPGAPKELSLDADVRDGVLRELSRNTHPDVFLPAYEAIFHTLQTVSLPRFLVQASAVTNRPKQLFWYAQGTLWILLGLLAFALSLAFAHWGHFRARALRLVAVLPITNGVMMIYTGLNGFCIKIAGRQRVQLRAWELEHADSSTHEWWAGIGSVPEVREDGDSDDEYEKMDDAEAGHSAIQLAQPSELGGSKSSILSGSLATVAARRARKRQEAMLSDVAVIAPFASRLSSNLGKQAPPVTITFTRTTTVAGVADIETAPDTDLDMKNTDVLHVLPPIKGTIDDDATASAAPSEASISQHHLPRLASERSVTGRSRRNSRNGFRPPAVFGPEKVVLDPRILAVHQQVKKRLLMSGLITIVVSIFLPFFSN